MVWWRPVAIVAALWLLLARWEPRAAAAAAQQHGNAGRDDGVALLHRKEARLHVGIVNQEPFHFEVLAGYMHLFGELLPKMTHMSVYMQRRRVNANGTLVLGDYGFLGLVKRHVERITELPGPLRSHDVLVFISPEYNVSWVASAIDQARPRMVMHLVHNAGTPLLRQLLSLHARTRLLTLAPHVLRYLVRRAALAGEEGAGALGHETAVTQAAWLLPTLPFNFKQPCLPPGDVGACASGFTIQGKINRHKRNYTHVFEQLLQARSQCGQGEHTCLSKLELHLVGALWTRLHVPQEARAWVHRRHYLSFPVFYELIHHTLALVPAVRSRQYYESKISSTLITSLVTGVPILADEAFLAPYRPLLNGSHAVVQQLGEDLAACMLHVLRAPPLQLAATRSALLALQQQLNRQAAAKMLELLMPLMQPSRWPAS